jgi:gamma-glutamyltranspeptidase
MSLEKAVRSILIADSTVTGLVASRVYPQRRPQGTAVPAIVYQNVFQATNEALATQGGIKRTRLSVEVFDKTYGATKTLRNAVESALINYTGTTEGETIDSLRLESAVDIDETNEPAGDFGYFRTILDFVIWHQ